ncbi:hypothetical protein V6N13_089349 [Hibiscus sabdariffa]
MDFAHGTVTSLSGQASSGRQSLKQWHNSDIGEFTLRDASSAASMHLKQPISKSEEARRLLFRADLTVHKVVVSPMIADTIKESSEYLVLEITLRVSPSKIALLNPRSRAKKTACSHALASAISGTKT